MMRQPYPHKVLAPMTRTKPPQRAQRDPEQTNCLEKELQDNDRQDFRGRLERFIEIDDLFQIPPGGLSLGPDFESGLALSEARFAYVNGLWLSAILMSLTAIERHLAWRLESIGKSNVERLRPQELIGLALQAGFVTATEATSINELRTYRNAYAHFRKESRLWKVLNIQQDRQQASWEASGEDDSIEGVDINTVLAPDAKAAVMLASAYFLVAGRDDLSDLSSSNGSH
jgi:hypothetical protein